MRWTSLFGLLLGCSLTSGAEPLPSSTRAPAAQAPAAQAPAAQAPAAQAPGVGLDYVTRVTAGADESARLPMIVAVHGLGDRPEEFITLFDSLPFAARVVALRGSTPFHGGFSWFQPGAGPAGDPSFLRAVDSVSRAIPALARRFATCGRPSLAGFSQGGMLTFAVAARSPSLLSAAVPIAGRLPTIAAPGARPSGALPAITALHGTADARIGFSEGELAVRTLAAQGFRAQMHAFAGVGHSVPPPVRDALFLALREGVEAGCAR